MSRMLDDLLYHATTPIRLFGRSRAFRIAVMTVLVAGAGFAATLWALDRFFPADTTAQRAVAKLPKLPPLPPLTRTSYVIAPVAISLAAIRQSLDNAAPRELTGKNDSPVSKLLSKANVGITISRGTMSVTGGSNELSINAPLTGSLQITGQLATQAGNLTNSIAGILDSSLGKQIGSLTGQVLDQHADVRGQVVIKSKPAITANWRLEPNLNATLGVGDSALNVAGIKINMASEARPLIDKAVSQQIAALEQRLRNDTTIERAARDQWTKMCRSIPLGGGQTGLPQLYLEIRPVRAAAAQPQIDARDVTLTIGVQAETRIVATATKPTCPFPAQIELVPPMQNGKLAVGLPIDVPFTAISKILEAQLKGRTYPEDKTSAFEVKVERATLAAAGERLLIALHVNAHERKSWFHIGGDADVLIWGRPVLDPKNQTLRLTDISLAVDSQAMLLGAAARAAEPYLEQALADHAVIDLKPFAADAKAKIAASLADFQKNENGVRVDAAVDDLRLTGVSFDQTTLRVIAEVNGSARVSVTRLPQ